MQLPDERTRFKWSNSSEPLPKHLENTLHQRISREAHNLFRKGYSAETHGRFAATLRSWMEGDTEYSSALADYYHGVLYGFPGELRRWPHGSLAWRRDFLEQFFKVEPELKKTFEDWIKARKPQPFAQLDM